MIRLRTLGSLTVLDESSRELQALIAQPKRLAILVYLAAARPLGMQRRDRLLALFWPELDTDRARDALSQALSFLRQALGSEAIARRGSEEVGLGSRIWCDAVAFKEAAEDGRAEEALDLYRGEFLAGFHIPGGGGFEEWLERERATLREQAAECGEAQGDKPAALAAVRRRVYNWLAMHITGIPAQLRIEGRLAAEVGDTAGAIRAYEHYLSLRDAPDTKEMVQQVQQVRAHLAQLTAAKTLARR